MSFNPLEEKGMPLEKQLRTWSELNSSTYSKSAVHPYSQARIILMNGIEVEAALFQHQFARHAIDPDLTRQLAMVRRIEQQQQKAVNWLVPGKASILEATIGYEQVAVDLTAFLARTVPDPYVKDVFDFGLLEDFDHLYRYANLMETLEGKEAESIVRDYTDVLPGRPTKKEHRHPYDDVRKPIDRKKSDPLTSLYCLLLMAGEQQTMNFYMNMGNRLTDPLGRALYLEIAEIEEQHVTQYESLLDPKASWFEMMLLHEYVECYLYWSFMNQEPNEYIKHIWETHLDMEIEHLKIAADLLKRREDKDPTSVVPKEMPDPVVFESNIEYVRGILKEQVDLTANEADLVPVSKLPKDHRYFSYQEKVNGDWVPSEVVIEENSKKNGADYQLKQNPKKK